MLRAIKTELLMRKNEISGEVNTVYFGGGTPTVLSIHDLESLIDIIFKNYNISPNPEITIEANPDDLSNSKTKALRTTGFNRLSIGIQSFDDSVLKYLNRIHNANDSFKLGTVSLGSTTFKK